MMQRDKVEVSGEATIDQAIRVMVGLDGEAKMLLRKSVSVPLNTGDQGKINGDTLSPQHGRGDR